MSKTKFKSPRNHTADEVKVIHVGEWKPIAPLRMEEFDNPGMLREFREGEDGFTYARWIGVSYKERVRGL